jgi:hypothetical protein
LARTDITKLAYIYPCLFTALGGMVYVVVTLTAVQWLAQYIEGGRIVVSGTMVQLFAPVMLIVGIGVLLCIACRSARGSTNFDQGDQSGIWTIALIFLIGLLALCLISVLGDFAAFLLASLCTSILSCFLTIFFDPRLKVRVTIVCSWFMGYVGLTMLGEGGPINLLVFVSSWLVYGGIAGAFVADLIRVENIADKERAESDAASARGMRFEMSADSGAKRRAGAAADALPAGGGRHDIRYRRRHTEATYSEFGRLPQDTANVLAHMVRRTTGPIIAALPLDASPDMTKDTVRIVLDYLLLDWRFNNNLAGLDDTDVQDIRSFIAFACSFVDDSYDQVGRAMYKTMLGYLMRDWLINWNAEGISGPPKD